MLMDVLFALPFFALLIFGFIFAIFFLVWPIVLLIQCLFFEKRVGIVYKLLTFFFSFICYPIPSFVYGAFIRKGIMSMIALVMVILGWFSLIIFIVFLGGLAIFSDWVVTNVDGKENPVSRIESLFHKQTDTDQTPEQTYPGYNTYEQDDVNVFEDGKGARKEIMPPQPEAITP